ncbi:hypothetical protein MY11210_002000 [Beauveria gryllotalpidicola]
MRRSRKGPATFPALVRKFMDCHGDPRRSFRLLRNHPALLGTHTISHLERDVYSMLLQAQPGVHSNRHVYGIICTAALLEMCAGQPQLEMQKRVERLAHRCKKTCRAYSEHVVAMCDRIMQKLDDTRASCSSKEQTRQQRRARIRFRRGGVVINSEKCNPDKELLDTMSFEKVDVALRKMSLEDREPALD